MNTRTTTNGVDIPRKERRKEKKAAVYNSHTRSSKAKAQEEYTKMNKTVRKSIKKDKLTYISGLADEAEEAARKGNLK